MDKVFLNVLHEEEKIENESLDMLKGGLADDDCECNFINIKYYPLDIF